MEEKFRNQDEICETDKVVTLDFVELSAVFQFGDFGIDKNVIRRIGKIDHLSYTHYVL